MTSRATRIWASNSGLWVVMRKPSGDSVTKNRADGIADLGEFERMHRRTSK
eukprot:gene43076-53462_t